ncbi:SMI1/KNR4 family protein [Aureliella helgolandensis]|uniref:Knr4/Smi1-like domain-containing protein n=1 Tax=Aureliella helgolandensis TaxID=2527968 RepID=A0A518G5L4_9BACT|nr:SMI1/KNR4 family protein [Aureliella helgolandensis]QDV23859.1 hypothetical protein Q31a_21660 [Aureliella helgolandensis]
MAKWNRIVSEFFRMSDPEGKNDHYAPSGASPESIVKVEAELGVEMPHELRDFYSNHDGLGLVSRGETPMPLFIRPTGQLVDFINQCRSAFRDTHPTYAERYFPFIDWYNGDSSGFILGSDGRFVDMVFTFSHELYCYEAGQDANEFIHAHAETLAELLAPG